MNRLRLAGASVAFLLVVASCSPSGDADTTTTSTVPAVTVVGDQPTAPPPDPAPIIPVIRRSGPQDDPIVGQLIHLAGSAFADRPIARLQLWVDGELVEDEVFDDPVVDPTFVWWWRPPEPGLHAALVHAHDTEGRVSVSLPTWIRAHPVDDEAFAAGASTAFAGASPISSLGVVVDEVACKATITVPPAPDSAGQTIAATTLGLTGFQALGVLGPAGGSVVMAIAATPIVLSVAQYTPTQATPLPPAMVVGVPSCAAGAWTGSATFDGLTLIDATGLESAYLYATLDGIVWQRVPGETGFVERGAAGFDFSGVLPQFDLNGSIEVEVWGWRGGSLVSLGRGTLAKKPPSGGQPEAAFGPVAPAKPFGQLNVVREIVSPSTGQSVETLLLDELVCPTGPGLYAGCDRDPVVLRWNMLAAAVPEAGLIQVSRTPPPSGPALAFPGLVATAMVATDGQARLDIPINSAAVFGSGGNLLSGQSTQPAAQVQVFTYANFDTQAADLSAAARGSGTATRGSSTFLIDLSMLDLAPPPGKVWIRILPLVDNKPVEGISNAVTLAVGGEAFEMVAPEHGLEFEVDFYHTTYGSPQFERCVRVIETPFANGANPDDLSVSTVSLQYLFDEARNRAIVYGPGGSQQKLGLVPGATVCAKAPVEKSKSLFDYIVDAVEFVASVWDMYVDLIDMLKSGIISGIVDITGCKPTESCKAALSVIADAGLAALGVPPSLPNFSQLVEAAKGDLAQLAAAAAADALGCDTLCDVWAEELINEIFDQIQAHVSDMAVAQAASGGYTLYLNRQITVVPEPAGQFFPGMIEVRATRPAGSALPTDPNASCLIRLEVTGAGPLSWTAASGAKHVDQHVQGTILPWRSIAFDPAAIAPGQTVTFALSAAADFERTHYLQGAGFGAGGYGYKSDADKHITSIRLIHSPDTLLTMQADVCGRPFSESFYKDPTSKDPSHFPTS